MKIQIVLFDGFGELVSFAPFEVLKRAIEEGAPFTVELVSSE
ncbi:DJ-1/PfpI family protein, partial [Bacillus wiedmannii]